MIDYKKLDTVEKALNIISYGSDSFDNQVDIIKSYLTEQSIDIGKRDTEIADLKDKLHRRNVLITDLRGQIGLTPKVLAEVKKVARYCHICGKITFDADTYGTWETDKNNRPTKKWHHYSCQAKYKDPMSPYGDDETNK